MNHCMQALGPGLGWELALGQSLLRPHLSHYEGTAEGPSAQGHPAGGGEVGREPRPGWPVPSPPGSPVPSPTQTRQNVRPHTPEHQRPGPRLPGLALQRPGWSGGQGARGRRSLEDWAQASRGGLGRQAPGPLCSRRRGLVPFF